MFPGDGRSYLFGKTAATKNSEGGYDLDAKPKDDEFEGGRDKMKMGLDPMMILMAAITIMTATAMTMVVVAARIPAMTRILIVN